MTEATEAVETEPPETAPAEMVAYKGFDADFRCRGFQYEIGQTYEMAGEPELCASGFHACPHPLDVFSYYPPAASRFAEVRYGGTIVAGDDKIASTRITVVAEIQIGDLIERAVKATMAAATWVKAASATGDRGAASATGDRGAASATGNRGAASATGDRGAASATGYRGAASATGDRGAASATGYRGAASATGYSGAASATGYRGAASATGDRGAASATGKSSTALTAGRDGRARASEGSALFLVERDEDWKIVAVFAGIAGRDGIEPDAFYTLRDGTPVKIEEDAP